MFMKTALLIACVALSACGDDPRIKDLHDGTLAITRPWNSANQWPEMLATAAMQDAKGYCSRRGAEPTVLEQRDEPSAFASGQPGKYVRFKCE